MFSVVGWSAFDREPSQLDTVALVLLAGSALMDISMCGIYAEHTFFTGATADRSVEHAMLLPFLQTLAR
jgi:hypothetical protein